MDGVLAICLGIFLWNNNHNYDEYILDECMALWGKL